MSFSTVKPEVINIDSPSPNRRTNANTKKSRSIGATKTTAIPESFSQKLGNILADGLVKDSNSFRDSLDLVDRLAFAKASNIAKTTISTITTTSEVTTTTTTTEKEQVLVLSPDVASSAETLTTDLLRTHQSKTPPRCVFDLNDFAALSALEDLIEQFGRVSHMGFLDKSYTFFITEDRRAALHYKVKNKVAVVGGDPLCKPILFPQILSEFETYRRHKGWGIAFLGAGETFVEYAKKQKWTTMCFGIERVLNPMTNPVLHGNAGKSITRTSKNLLDPKKEGITLEVYTPRLGKNIGLQRQLVEVYEEWRDHRNGSKKPQAFITVYDPFALPDLMTYIYSRDRKGTPNGFAALRILGANKGYHLDPYVATPGAPKGITDLLLYGTMALLDQAKISYLSLGYEPLDDIGEISGMPNSIAYVSRKVHRRIFRGIHVAGKKDYHDKFRPDEAQQSNLYLVFPPGIPTLKHMTAIVHVANIKLRQAMFTKPLTRDVEEESKNKQLYGGNSSGAQTSSSGTSESG